jgi:hypothetical protein
MPTESNEGDNTLTMSFTFPVLLPNLRPRYSIVAPPRVVTAGTRHTIYYDVDNVGWGVVPFGTIWGDNLLIRDQFNATIATFNRAVGTATQPGSSYTRATTITIPLFCFGEVRLVAVVDSVNAVLETTDDDNEISTRLLCLPQPTADLVPMSLSALVSEIGVMELTWTVTNIGQTIIGPHSRWQDVCSLASSNQTDDPSQSLTLLGRFTFILPLVSQASWTNTRFVAIPPSLPSGNYYVTCTVDAEHEVSEGADGESNNVVFTTTSLSLTFNASTPWTVRDTADLTVAAVNGSLVVSYGRISVDFVVTNIGGSDAVASPRWYDAIGVSVDDTWDPVTGIVLFPSLEHTTSLSVGRSYNVSVRNLDFRPRDIPTEVHLFAITDIGWIIADNNRSNNALRLTEVPIDLLSVTAADLTSAGVTPTSRQYCVDTPPGWVDSSDDGCATYVDDLWCTPQGATGSGWSSGWGSIEDWAQNGVSALDACCGCGGGIVSSGSSSNPIGVIISTTIELMVCSNNSGSSPAVAPWFDELVLSNDNVVDGGDIRLARVQFTDDIVPGAVGCVTTNVAFSRVPLGLGYLLHMVDVSASVADHSEYAEASGRMAVTVMPPPSADLEII